MEGGMQVKYLTGLNSRKAWHYLLAALFFRFFQPWKNLRLIRTGPIWEGEKQDQVYELIDRYMSTGGDCSFSPYFGKRFAWINFGSAPGGLFGRRKARPRWSIGAGFDQVRRFFGDELGEPLIRFTEKRLAEIESEDARYNYVELYIFRALHDGPPANFPTGHSHALTANIALFKMEWGSSTRVRADGMGYGAPVGSLVSVDTDHALRFTHSWHAGPPLKEGEVRFGIVLNARDEPLHSLKPEDATS